MTEKYYPRDARFTEEFLRMTYKFDGLNTSVAFSKVHQALNEFWLSIYINIIIQFLFWKYSWMLLFYNKCWWNYLNSYKISLILVALLEIIVLLTGENTVNGGCVGLSSN